MIRVETYFRNIFPLQLPGDEPRKKKARKDSLKQSAPSGEEPPTSTDDAQPKIRGKTFEHKGWMVDEEKSDHSDTEYDDALREEKRKQWKIEEAKEPQKKSGRERQAINRKTRGFAVTGMVMKELKERTLDAKKIRKMEAAENESDNDDDDEESQPKLTGKAKRAMYNAQKVKRIGTHYYETANVKNRNRDKVGTVDPELANRGHQKTAKSRSKRPGGR